MATYTLTASGRSATRSSDGADIPWDRTADRPSDIDGLAGRTWVEDGSPASVPAPPPPAPIPYLTGRDVIDGLSPAQAKAANAVDPRNLVRVSAADTAAGVKSCIKRIADANGTTPAALLAQATPTGTA